MSHNPAASSKRSSKTWYFFGVSLACVALSLLVWWMRRPPDLESEARMVFEASAAGDARILMRYAFPDEVRANSLNVDKLSRLYHELILPKLKVDRDLKPIAYNVGGGYVQATNGPFNASVFLTESGSRSPVTTRLLEAWASERSSELGRSLSPIERIDAVVAGLRKDRTTLDSIGIRAVIEVSPFEGEVKLIPLDTLETRYLAWRADIVARGHAALHPAPQ